VALIDQFKRAGENGKGFRALPFWSWNDELDPEELARQVRDMARVGLGGHFMHARRGLITEYMGSEWLRCIKETVRASKEAGVQAWLYDEDCWPSGSGGGAIPAMGEEFVAKRLRWETIPPAGFKPTDHTVATFLLGENELTLEAEPVDPKNAARRAKGDERLLHFFYEPWAAYTDLLNPKAVKAFIRHTYGAYSKAVGREFGKTIPGIFTDEPMWSGVPWSAALPKFFRSLHDYDLLPALAGLAYQIGDYRALRYDFWRAATELFVRSFTEQIGTWCGRHKLALTGHLMAEDNLSSQLHATGAAMPHYEHMQVPGIDHLCRRITDPLLCKQASSVAHQMGGRRVLSEMFGCSGWNVSLEELKWMADWQFALGVDLVCPHLSLYSARGCRKRDYPPSLHHQQPWWDDYGVLNDYMARVTFMLTRGKHVADVLVIHSIESAWAVYEPGRTAAIDGLSRALSSVAETLLGSHVDFDFADEGMLARHARVASKRLRVSHAEYRVVIVPPCVTLRSTTLDVLKRFIRRGGKVIVAGPVPRLVDGRSSDQPEQVLEAAHHIATEPAEIKAAVEAVLPPRIAVLDDDREDARHIYVQERDAGDHRIYFLANTSRTEATSALVRLAASGRLEEWDPETGESEPIRTRKRGKVIEATLDFAPMGSRLLVLARRRRAPAIRTRRQRPAARIELSEAWELEAAEPNTLTLDTCSYRVGDGEWSKPTPVLDVQDAIKAVEPAQICEFCYRFRADFAAKRPQELFVAVENPEMYEILMNGVPVPVGAGEQELPWWKDISFRLVDVRNLLKPQDRNEIVLRRGIAGAQARRERLEQPAVTRTEKNRLRYGPEIESIYLVGDFLVRSRSPYESLDRGALRTEGEFALVDTWHHVTTGDLVPQGFPFYAGPIRLRQTVTILEKQLKSAKRATVHLEPPDAITTKIIVNGAVAALRGWRPYEVEVGQLLVPGRNDVEVQLTGSCRNLLGPHHHVDGELHAVGPGSFRRQKSWTDASGTPEAIWTDSYSFVRFGLTGPVTLTLWK